jgi:hypothetical protein
LESSLGPREPEWPLLNGLEQTRVLWNRFFAPRASGNFRLAKEHQKLTDLSDLNRIEKAEQTTRIRVYRRILVVIKGVNSDGPRIAAETIEANWTQLRPLIS